MLNTPNALTIGRILAIPLIVACLTTDPANTGARALALALFIAASVTDWLDGYLARTWKQQSAIGAMLDPIADKLLVGAILVMLVADATISGVHVLAVVTIICRELLVSGLREVLAGAAVKLPVSFAAKAKTAVQMTALAALIAAPMASETIAGAGLLLLWAAALLSAWTGAEYTRAALRFAISQDRSETQKDHRTDDE
ncbi:MAG: CDP-diacylglycerol--glycerol-3-phosphate 3-phosphatidyltransferase [Pseudomonadota bacterium]